MKRFLIKTICFFLPILIIALLMEILIRNIPNDFKYKKSYLDKHSNEVETLILGNSHSFYGLNPEYFDTKTFNASHNSQSLDYDLEILNRYGDNFKNLKTIVLPISYFLLYGKMEVGIDYWRIKNYVIYYNSKRVVSFTDYSEVLSNRLNINVKRLISYYIKKENMISCIENGWGNRFNSKNAKDLVKTGKASAKRHTRKIKSKLYQAIFADNLLVLDLIIDFSRERNINILFVTLPAFESYYKNLDEEQLRTTIETMEKIASKYDNCKYINLLEDKNFTSKDFYDGDHLSEIGAEKLSKLINSIINK